MREFRRFTLLFSAALAAMVVSFVGCSDPDYTIGSGFLSDGHLMDVGGMDFAGLDSDGNRVISSRYYYSNRINSANQTTAMFGAQYDEHFGKRLSGFYSQYTPQYTLDEDEFGYDPILDSVIIFFTLSNYAGDTTRVNKFVVYEVLNDDFLGDYDSSDDDDYLVTDSDEIVAEFAKDGVLSDPLFTFVFPDQANGIYLASGYARMDDITDAGKDLIDRLMLVTGDYDYEIYTGDVEDFVEVFKGLYVTAADDTELDPSKLYDGATYATSFSSAGFGFYARSRYEDDPTLIKDTVGMSYIFRNDYYTVGGVSINTTVRDYSDTSFTVSNVKTENNPTVETTGTIAVEGMGGVVSELTFEQTLFQQFEAAIAESEEYNNIFFNTVRLSIYNTHATGYGVYSEDSSLQYTLDDMPSRLGLYINYSTYLDENEELETETAADYDFYSESMYSTTSIMDGSLYRSRGCYSMYISLQMQDFWNDYVEAKEANGGEAFTQSEWDAMDWNKLYLAPLVTDLFTPRYALLQGQADGENVAPLRLEIAYTLFKK